MRREQIYQLLNDDPVSQELVNAAIPARLAYLGLDGAPRVIPIGFDYDGTHFTVSPFRRRRTWQRSKPTRGWR